MKRTRKHPRKSSLVAGYLERISSKIFSDFSQQLTDLIGKQHGVYALYKGNRLYYVGLATNLRGRVTQHLRDKHAGKWDKFSLYLVKDAEHIRELESLVLRIANPKGNTSRSRLSSAENLKAALESGVKAEMEKRLRDLLGGSKRASGKSKPKPNQRKARNRQPTLSPYITRSFRIRGSYKGQEFSATVYRSGSIKFQGKLYNSPSMAGRAARGKSTNGWDFWHFRNGQGDWGKLDELRQKGP